MTHNEKRTHWVREGFISMGTGIIFGIAVTATAHPFDTIKTKMQAQIGYENTSMVRTLIKVVKNDGILGLYRGCIPPLCGSCVFRSVQFSAFEATYTLLNNDIGKKQIPFTNGIELRVICGGIMSGTCRSFVETPLEYAKIQRQMGRSWSFNKCYTGLKITWMRACSMMPAYFVFLDSFRRHFDDLFKSKVVGPFLASGCSSLAAGWLCWPLDILKSQIQAGYLAERNMSILERVKFIIRERGGIQGLYRGLGPGSLRSFIGNGSGMVVMQYTHKKVTEFGLRDE